MLWQVVQHLAARTYYIILKIWGCLNIYAHQFSHLLGREYGNYKTPFFP